MNLNHILIILGSILTVLLAINGFFIAWLVRDMYQIKIDLAVLINKEVNNTGKIDKLEERVDKLEEGE